MTLREGGHRRVEGPALADEAHEAHEARQRLAAELAATYGEFTPTSADG
ncbi:hypothetical protein [Streptomyces viridosporus]|nr:hypothetical protein [Streptomyces viridosporus]